MSAKERSGQEIAPAAENCSPSAVADLNCAGHIIRIALTTKPIANVSVVNPQSPTIVTPRSPVASASARCTLLGHKVHHTTIAPDASARCARCGAVILDRVRGASRVAHTLSCFFGWHHYIPVASRAAHNEYVCERCGHPLLFELGRDPYTGHDKFRKKVNYACGLFGHRVHAVESGPETTEYACRCGHSFLKTERTLTVIRHPLTCVVLGHYVTVNEIRGEWTEYVCVRCGHPFCFRVAACSQQEVQEQRLHV